jgi:membrane associated rhomboid family serine protease
MCPECMRSAAVGHQCVECVNDAARGVRQPTTAFGGREANVPLVTYVLIAINVAMFVVQTVSPEFEKQFFLWPNGIAHYDQFYRLLTSGFLHTGITHIAFNMIALYFTGPALERAMGHTRFLALYVLSLLGGSVLVYLLTPVGTPTLGASGAIFGLFGASFVLARKLQFDIRGIVGLIVINLVITFVAPGISWQGHIGGLVTGAAVAAVFAYAPRANRTLIQAGCSVAMLALFAALIWWRTVAIVTGVS